MKILKILILTRYDSLGASSRLRFLSYFNYLRENDIKFDVNYLINNDALSYYYKNKRRNIIVLLFSYFKRFLLFFDMSSYNLVWIEKECFPWVPFIFEKFFLRKINYVLDYDDAIFHNYDLNNNIFLNFTYRNKIDKLMKNSSLTIAGNDYLKNRAIEAGATNVIIIPTVIDLKRYKPKNYTLNNNTHLKLIWIGNPSTVHYLEILKEPLIELSKIYNIKLIIVGASFSIDGVSIEEVLWSEDTENAIINSCDVGLMPLIDSPWERGKCGYKLIQYMASGLPVIASDVGANSNIIKTDYNGFLVNSTSQWIFALNLLLKDKCLRKKMGINGRKIVADKFSLQKTAAEYVKYLKLSSNKL